MKPRYSVREIGRASPINPLPERKRLFQLTKMHAALDEMERGKAPTHAHWSSVYDAVRIVTELVAMNLLRDDAGLIADAEAAMGRATTRAYRLDSAGMLALRSILTDYEDAMKELSERTMLAAHRRAEQRLIEADKKDRK